MKLVKLGNVWVNPDQVKYVRGSIWNTPGTVVLDFGFKQTLTFNDTSVEQIAKKLMEP